jgi:prepilin-type N-terminal cleavage/methylation domain-containing protein
MRQRGFSLAEVLAGLVILTIVITTSLAVFVERNRRLQQASETILAYQALANESEHWRRMEYADVESTTEFESEDLSIIKPLKPYETEVGVVETAGVKHVTLTLRWAHRKREAKLDVVRVRTGGTPLW